MPWIEAFWDKWCIILAIGLLSEQFLRNHVAAYRQPGPLVKGLNRAALVCSTAKLMELEGLQTFCVCSVGFFVALELLLDTARKAETFDERRRHLEKLLEAHAHASANVREPVAKKTN